MQQLFGGSELGGDDEDLIVLMLPTAPLRSAQTLQELVSLCKGTGRDCFTCCMYDFHVSFAFEIDTERNKWRPLIDNSPMCTGNTRSQDQTTFFHPHGGAQVFGVGIYVDRSLPFMTTRFPCRQIGLKAQT